MTPLHTLLAAAEGSDLIRKFWGEIPCFDGYCDIIHLSHDVSTRQIVLTCLFITNESDDGNKCKPSQIRIRFSDVSYWECHHDNAEANGIAIAAVLKQPPVDFIAVDVQRSFYILCRQITILDCERRPFIDLSDESVAT